MLSPQDAAGQGWTSAKVTEQNSTQGPVSLSCPQTPGARSLMGLGRWGSVSADQWPGSEEQLKAGEPPSEERSA